MLIAFERLLGAPVMSLQTGGQLARTKQAIIDPRDLTILAYELEGSSIDASATFLLMSDVREVSNIGLIVDSSEEFVGRSDIVKLDEVCGFDFELIGKAVRSESGSKLGKVIGYAVEPASFMIKQLAVKRPILKSLNDTELLIDRTQIFEVNDREITIKHDERRPVPVERVANTFTNPFRQQHPQRDGIRTR